MVERELDRGLDRALDRGLDRGQARHLHGPAPGAHAHGVPPVRHRHLRAPAPGARRHRGEGRADAGRGAGRVGHVYALPGALVEVSQGEAVEVVEVALVGAGGRGG